MHKASVQSSHDLLTIAIDSDFVIESRDWLIRSAKRQKSRD